MKGGFNIKKSYRKTIIIIITLFTFLLMATITFMREMEDTNQLNYFDEIGNEDESPYFLDFHNDSIFYFSRVPSHEPEGGKLVVENLKTKNFSILLEIDEGFISSTAYLDEEYYSVVHYRLDNGTFEWEVISIGSQQVIDKGTAEKYNQIPKISQFKDGLIYWSCDIEEDYCTVKLINTDSTGSILSDVILRTNYIINRVLSNHDYFYALASDESGRIFIISSEVEIEVQKNSYFLLLDFGLLISAETDEMYRCSNLVINAEEVLKVTNRFCLNSTKVINDNTFVSFANDSKVYELIDSDFIDSDFQLDLELLPVDSNHILSSSNGDVFVYSSHQRKYKVYTDIY